MSTKEMEAFNTAAHKFVQFQEKGPVANNEGLALFMEMLKVAPERVRQTIMLGASRDGLLPMVVTKPPIGKTYWGWVFSADDFYERMQDEYNKESFDLKLKSFQDACTIEGVDPSPLIQRYRANMPDADGAKKDAFALFDKLTGKGNPK